MNAYIYQADLWCEHCTLHIKHELDWWYEDLDEHEYDSDEYPKGPYPDGGGESDTPSHCAGCNLHLENPLTEDGQVYVFEKVTNGDGWRPVLEDWAAFYSYLFTTDWWRDDGDNLV